MSKNRSAQTQPQVRLEISVGEQRLRLRRGGTILMTCAISTSKWGLGSEAGSHRTPVGRFRVKEKHGEGELPGTIFRSRQPVGRWRPGGRWRPDDLITSRILWLDGGEPGNANTFERFIYLHGTNQEHRLGTPDSHGCIRLSNDDIIRLFNLVPAGTLVTIH